MRFWPVRTWATSRRTSRACSPSTPSPPRTPLIANSGERITPNAPAPPSSATTTRLPKIRRRRRSSVLWRTWMRRSLYPRVHRVGASASAWWGLLIRPPGACCWAGGEPGEHHLGLQGHAEAARRRSRVADHPEDIGGGCAGFDRDEVGVHPAYLRAADTEALEPGGLDQTACGVAFGIAEHAAAGRLVDRLVLPRHWRISAICRDSSLRRRGAGARGPDHHGIGGQLGVPVGHRQRLCRDALGRAGRESRDFGLHQDVAHLCAVRTGVHAHRSADRAGYRHAERQTFQRPSASVFARIGMGSAPPAVTSPTHPAARPACRLTPPEPGPSMTATPRQPSSATSRFEPRPTISQGRFGSRQTAPTAASSVGGRRARARQRARPPSGWCGAQGACRRRPRRDLRARRPVDLRARSAAATQAAPAAAAPPAMSPAPSVSIRSPGGRPAPRPPATSAWPGRSASPALRRRPRPRPEPGHARHRGLAGRVDVGDDGHVRRRQRRAELSASAARPRVAVRLEDRDDPSADSALPRRGEVAIDLGRGGGRSRRRRSPHRRCRRARSGAWPRRSSPGRPGPALGPPRPTWPRSRRRRR